jgi:hypothetical protein
MPECEIVNPALLEAKKGPCGSFLELSNPLRLSCLQTRLTTSKEALNRLFELEGIKTEDKVEHASASTGNVNTSVLEFVFDENPALCFQS